MCKITFVLVLVFATLAMSHSSGAQGGRSLPPQIWGDPHGFTGRDCETSMMLLDFVAAADRDAANNQVVIIIGRLGSGERSPGLIRRRLRQISDYLGRKLPKENIIAAEGARIRGLGQLEFYVAGKLHTVIKVARNRDLVKGCTPAG